MKPNSSLRAALSALLDALSMSEHLTPRLAVLRTRLATEPDSNQTCEFLGQITMIVTEAHSVAEENRRDHDVFLIQLTESLQQMEKILQAPLPATDGSPAREPAIPETLDARWFEQAIPVRAMVQELASRVTVLRQNLAQQGFQALNDPLTGIANRLGFEQRLRQEYARWKRYASPLVAQMWCVDGYESIRLQHGRQAGDMVLLRVARLISGNLRETDFVARYENENFAVILPETLLEGTHVVAERLRKKISASRFHHQGQVVSVTLSCGYAALEEGDTVPALFQRLHQALARARTAGGGGYSAG
ncbi:MAG: GGDEF domain-containing protein [Sulfuricaulis sp.]|nr:GGDEF domain-containing protein [Sulfuricaulis sp.]